MANKIERLAWIDKVSEKLISSLAQNYYKNEIMAPSIVETDAVRKDKCNVEAHVEMNTLAQTLSTGFRLILEELHHSFPKEFDEFFMWFSSYEEKFDAWMKRDLDGFKEKIEDISSLQELWGLSDVLLNNMYQAACEIYKANRFEDAIKMFSFLTLMQPARAKFWTMLGLSQQFNHSPVLSLYSYATALALDPLNPFLHCYNAECWITLKGWNQAQREIQSCLDAIQDSTEHQKLREYCEKLKQLKEYS
jgi:hypothetical protein